MKNKSDTELCKKVVKFIEENQELFEREDGIVLKNNCVILNRNGVEEVITLDYDEILKLPEGYPKINYYKYLGNQKTNPLESDREKNRMFWKQKSKKDKICFSRFMPIGVAFIVLEKRFPNFMEFCKAFYMLYIEKVENVDLKLLKTEKITDEILCYDFWMEDMENEKKELVDGNPNIWLTFKDKDLVKMQFPYFLLSQLLCRLYRVYPSIIRDLYTVLLINKNGGNAVYSYYLDIYDKKDMLIFSKSGKKYYISSFVNTESAKIFYQQKTKDGADAICLLKSEKKDKYGRPIYKLGLVVMSVKEVLTFINNINRGEYDNGGTYEYYGE